MLYSTYILPAMLLLQTAMTSPIEGETFDLATRSTTKKMRLYYCNRCTPSSSGSGVSCDQTVYAHTLGDGKDQSCSKDPSEPFNKGLCSTYGTVKTPFGQGDWHASSKCPADHTNDKDGTVEGEITPHDGSTAWSCTCTGDSGKFNSDCYGEQYVCQKIYYCACTHV